jgi:hypothetical protein
VRDADGADRRRWGGTSHDVWRFVILSDSGPSSQDFQFLFGLSCKMGFGESPAQKSLFRPGTLHNNSRICVHLSNLRPAFHGRDSWLFFRTRSSR